MNFVVFAAFAFLLVAALGCEKPGVHLPEDTITRSKSGSCGTEVKADYETLLARCEETKFHAGRKQCKLTAQAFLAKYPDINCDLNSDVATAQTASGDQKPSDATQPAHTPEMITSEGIQSLISSLKLI